MLNKQSKLCFLKNTRSAVLTAENGDIFRLKLVTTNNIVTKLAVEHTGNRADVSSTVSTFGRSESRWFSKAAKNGRGLVFLGSWLGDSLLLSYELTSAPELPSAASSSNFSHNDVVKSEKHDDSEDSDEDAAFLKGAGVRL